MKAGRIPQFGLRGRSALGAPSGAARPPDRCQDSRPALFWTQPQRRGRPPTYAHSLRSSNCHFELLSRRFSPSASLPSGAALGILPDL